MHALLERELKADVPLYPMVRGRLVAVNDVPVDSTRLTDARARRLAEREFNLSWMTELPRSNRVVAGQWWKAGDAGVMSLEDGIAETLGVKLGDVLTYDIAGTRVSARVANLRKVDWDSFRVNFFALYPPGMLDGLPTTYIAAARAPDNPRVAQRTAGAVSECARDRRRRDDAAGRRIMEQVARAVEFVFLFTLAGGVLVLQAAIAVDAGRAPLRRGRAAHAGRKPAAVDRGAARRISGAGGIGGPGRGGGATAIAYVLADRVFHIPFGWNPWLWVIGIVGGALGVAAAGWLGTRRTLRQPPLALLRQFG